MQIFVIGDLYTTAIFIRNNYGLEFLKIQLNFVCTIIDEVNRRINTRKKLLFNSEVDLYINHLRWLYFYSEVLELIHFGHGYDKMAKEISNEAEECKPNFHTEKYYLEMKRKLNDYYEKNKQK